MGSCDSVDEGDDDEEDEVVPGDDVDADGDVEGDDEVEGESLEDEDQFDMVHASKPTVELRMSEGAKLPRARLPPTP